MKIWLIKLKGASWWGNMELSLKTTITRGKQEYVFYADPHFYNRKHAIEYMKSKGLQDYYEVIGVELPKSKQDNRRATH